MISNHKCRCVNPQRFLESHGRGFVNAGPAISRGATFRYVVTSRLCDPATGRTFCAPEFTDFFFRKIQARAMVPSSGVISSRRRGSAGGCAPQGVAAQAGEGVAKSGAFVRQYVEVIHVFATIPILLSLRPALLSFRPAFAFLPPELLKSFQRLCFPSARRSLRPVRWNRLSAPRSSRPWRP
jgi:hypothetical protein